MQDIQTAIDALDDKIDEIVYKIYEVKEDEKPCKE